MTRATVVKRNITLIEFHDGEIESISIGMDGSMRIQFAHLAVYHEVSPQKFEIWSYRAALETTGTERLQINGPSNGPDYVSDITVTTAAGGILNGKTLLDRRSVAGLSIVFGSGRTVDANCSSAQLFLQEAVKHVEDWTGPLVSEPPPH